MGGGGVPDQENGNLSRWPQKIGEPWDIFDRFCGFLMQKGKNVPVLNPNNRRLGRLKVQVINQKKIPLSRYI